MKRIIDWVKIAVLSLMIRISLALKEVEEQFKAQAADLVNGIKREFKRRSSNPLLRKFEQGETDERYVQQYYEILKKADEVVRSTNPDKAAKLADKHGVNIGAKDKWGMRWDHHGFLDPKHKHYGKTLKEIRDLELKERQTQEDAYPVIAMFSNIGELSFLDTTKVVKTEADMLAVPQLAEMAKLKKFPLTVIRKNQSAVNRIEQLCDYVHVKGITSKHFLLEFFIPTKFGLKKHDSESLIFKELVDIDQVWFTDEYGDKHFYKVTGFHKRADHQQYMNEKKELVYRYELIKFKAEIIETLNTL
jgi:hypothetical protein